MVLIRILKRRRFFVPQIKTGFFHKWRNLRYEAINGRYIADDYPDFHEDKESARKVISGFVMRTNLL
jgi:hypothetical protein